jgi:hypothetical protein
VLAVHAQAYGTDIELLLGALKGALGKALCLGQRPQFADRSWTFLQSLGEEFAGPVTGKTRQRRGFLFQELARRPPDGAEPARYGEGVSLGRGRESQTRLRRGQIVFELSQGFAIGLLGIQGDEPARTTHAQEAHGTAAAVKRPAAVSFVEMADQQDDALVFACELEQREKGPANTLIAAAMGPEPQKSHDRIDHEQAGSGARYRLM